MKGSRGQQSTPLPAIRKELAARLRKQAPEITEAIFSHLQRLPEPVEGDDVDYVEGLRTAVAQVVDHGIMIVEEDSDPQDSPIPQAALAQARRAARSGVRLDTVLRRYSLGERLLGGFVMNEVKRFPSDALWQILVSQVHHLDNLMDSVAAEYTRELEHASGSSDRRRMRCAEALLNEEPMANASGLDHDLDAWHLGMILQGDEGGRFVQSLARQANCMTLIIPRGDSVIWAWLSGYKRMQVEKGASSIHRGIPDGIFVAMGEPHAGLVGWRLSHGEAQVAYQIMLREPQKAIRGADVLLPAAVLRNKNLAEALRLNYLSPLDQNDPAVGQMLRKTLLAYFATDGNALKAGVTLGVNRQTVQRRILKVEELLGRLIRTCRAELEVALQVERLEARQDNGRRL